MRQQIRRLNAIDYVAIASFGEKILQRRKALELDRSAGRVEKKHGGLLTRLTLEADVRLNHKMGASSREFVCQSLPLGHVQHRAEVAHRHVVAIDCAGLVVAAFIWCQMRNDLMTIKIEVYPIGRTTAFRTTQQVAIKLAC